MPGKVLIVDDNAMVREAMEGLLFPLGYDLYLASSGQEALDQLDTVHPDVILLDVMMPGLDGFEVCRRIRESPRWREIPVLLVTALSDRESRIQGLQAGADDFLTKPVDKVELQARVQTTVHLGRIRRQLQEKARFEWTVMHSNEGFFWLDGDGVCQGANPVARRWLGLGEDQAPQIPWLDIASLNFQMQPFYSWAELQEAEEPFQITLIRPETLYARDLWLQVAGAPLPDKNEATAAWMCHIQDVTALQRQMHQAITLVHQISHKLRTPLALMKTPLQLLSEGMVTTNHPEWPELRDILNSGFERITAETQQVVHLAQSLERPILSREHQSIGALEVAACVERVRQQIELPLDHCRLEQEGDPALPINSDVLELILYQLMTNSVKFHPYNLPSVVVSVQNSNDEVHLTVADDGPGIPQEHQSQVWQPLYQIDKQASGQISGAGVGLSLVANYVWRVGGRCWVASGMQGGTQIHLAFPSLKAAVAV